MTLAALSNSLLVNNPDPLRPDWDTEWRRYLVTNLVVVAEQLWSIGIADIFVDGSFVEDKAHPNDIDGYFVCEKQYLARGLRRDLQRLDGAWTWDDRTRLPHPDSDKQQLPMWHKYRVEMYPHVPGLLSGIRDEFGNELEFAAAFRKQRGTYRLKGIVKVLKS